MVPGNNELEKVFKLYREYVHLSVYEQQRINMFDYIRKHWNDEL